LNKIPLITKVVAEGITENYSTPYYIYDEKSIRENARRVHKAFSWNSGFTEYFAVKATPTPRILQILAEEKCGFDCATITELKLAEKAVPNCKIMFTSNDTPNDDFVYARRQGENTILNLDDITHIDIVDKLCGLPETISLRYNPGYFALDKKYAPQFTDGMKNVIGEPSDAKYGLTTPQLFEAYKILLSRGVKRFGLHAMLASNTITNAYYPSLAGLLFDTAVKIKKDLGIELSFINFSGGVGIPYRPEDTANDIDLIAGGVQREYEEKLVPNGLDKVAIFTEMGRFMLAPYGHLITRAIREKHTHKEYIGVDACASNLMRPAIYGAYHHISILGKESQPLDKIYDITGGLCENCDKFAIDRAFPKIEMGDLLAIHDVGAHGHSMGYNYNGKLRCAELLLKENGNVELIRRAETVDDYFSTMIF
jgi:diaminopimelate decarboxylase